VVLPGGSTFLLSQVLFLDRDDETPVLADRTVLARRDIPSFSHHVRTYGREAFRGEWEGRRPRWERVSLAG
jgi:hypothetical protein